MPGGSAAQINWGRRYLHQLNYFFVMVIEMKKDATPDDVRVALEQLAAAKLAERKRKRLESFGAWKSAVDGLDFQRERRDEWN